VVGAELVKPTGMDIQFKGGSLNREATSADLGQEVANQRRWQTMGQL
jgi:hypothetical protein